MTLSSNELEIAGETIAGTVAAPGQSVKAIEGRSLGQLAWRQLKSDKVAMAGGIWAILLILVAILAPVLTAAYGVSPYALHPNLINESLLLPFGSFGGISGSHWLGLTPVEGQDIMAELIYGARTSLEVAGAAVVLALLFGVSLGVIAGYYRGVTDTIISRVMDLLLSFPTLLFSIALLAVASLIPGLQTYFARFCIISFVLGFFSFPYIGRIVRGQVLSLREKEFVDAARSIGASNWRIMSREIMPNLVGPILVYTTLTIPNFILGEASLSYLGVGFGPTTVSWGSMLSDANKYVRIDPSYLFMPGLMLFLAVLAFNLFGDGLRDALDPRSRR
jgi:peptide/nickel transport system permease protein